MDSQLLSKEAVSEPFSLWYNISRAHVDDYDPTRGQNYFLDIIIPATVRFEISKILVLQSGERSHGA